MTVEGVWRIVDSCGVYASAVFTADTSPAPDARAARRRARPARQPLSSAAGCGTVLAMGTRYVAFLRGLNVGGHRVAMPTLKREFEALGLDEVATFIASGNVVFRTDAALAEVETAIEERLRAALGYDVPAFLRTDAEVAEIAARRPFAHVEPRWTHHVLLFKRPLSAAAQRRVGEVLRSDYDDFVCVGKELHWMPHGGMSASPLTVQQWKAADLPLCSTRSIRTFERIAAKWPPA